MERPQPERGGGGVERVQVCPSRRGTRAKVPVLASALSAAPVVVSADAAETHKGLFISRGSVESEI